MSDGNERRIVVKPVASEATLRYRDWVAENRRFVERFVAGWPSAAQIVIVHGGQVVMDQRISMDQFNGDRGIIETIEGLPKRFAGGVHQHWTDSFAGAKHRIAHGLMQFFRGTVCDG